MPRPRTGWYVPDLLSITSSSDTTQDQFIHADIFLRGFGVENRRKAAGLWYEKPVSPNTTIIPGEHEVLRESPSGILPIPLLR